MKIRKYEAVPITSKARFKEIDQRRREINRLNRQRAKAMEKRVARYLDGTQTPQSGAGSAKGDILIDFVNRPGKYMIECKLSETLHNGKSSIVIRKSWLDKMNKDAKSMRALFPVLVVHFHNVSGDWVFIEVPHLNKLGIYPEQIDDTPVSTQSHDNTAKTFRLYHVQAKVTDNRPYYYLLSVNNVVYYVLGLEYFKSLLKNI